jgi:hypothetical protein
LTRVAGPWKIQAVQARPAGILSCFALIFVFMPSTTVASPGQTTPVDLSVETLRVGGAGTETLSTDEARIFLGKSGVLEKELTLRGRTARRPQATERIRLHAEFRPLDLTPTGLTVAILSQVRVLAVSGGGALPRGEISHAANVEVLAGGSQLVTVYESMDLGVKLTLNLRWSLPDESDAGTGEPVPLEFGVRVYEVLPTGETLVSESQLPTLLGHEAVTTVDRVVPVATSEGDEKRVRHDRMEIRVVARYLSARSLSIGLTVQGELVTLTSQGNYSHPLAHGGNYLLSPLIPESTEVEISSDSVEKEGWERVRFRLEILASF